MRLTVKRTETRDGYAGNCDKLYEKNYIAKKKTEVHCFRVPCRFYLWKFILLKELKRCRRNGNSYQLSSHHHHRNVWQFSTKLITIFSSFFPAIFVIVMLNWQRLFERCYCECYSERCRWTKEKTL